MSWIDKLKTRWSLKTTGQVVLVLMIFACTGFTILYLKRPILAFVTNNGTRGPLYTFLAYLIILPVYNVVILIYGFIFGQFNFFWNFQTRIYRRLIGNKQNDLPKE